MPRPRKVSDEGLIAAAGAVIARSGPGFTLAEVGAEVGVTAGTLVARFGSKHGLLVAMFRREVEAAQTPLDRSSDVVTVLVDRYGQLDDPATAANNLAQLAVDVTDPELRELMALLQAATEGQLRPLLRAAVARGELPGAPAAPTAARILAALADGTALRWSASPRGSLARRLRTDLAAVVAGWRRP